MSLSPYPHTLTAAPHSGLHLLSCLTLIASTQVTNQRHYKRPGLSPCKSRIVVVFLLLTSLACFPVFVCSPPAYWTLALVYRFILLAQPLTDYIRHGSTLACFTDFYCALPSLYLSAIVVDPACSTMYLSRPLNKSLQMDPLASHLSLPVTEQSITTGPSSFLPGHSHDMDTDRILCRIKQGPHTLDQYIREFLSISNYSTLPDCLKIEIFCDGVNEHLKAKLRRVGPRSSLEAFMNFALLCVGSPERDNAVMATARPTRRLAVTPEHDPTNTFSAWIAREMAAPVRKMAATVEPVCKMAAKAGLHHVTAALPKPYQVAAAFPESSQVSESSQVAAAFPESGQVSKSSQVAAVFPESSKLTAATPESSKIAATVPVSSQATAAVPVSSQAGAMFPAQVKTVIPVSSQITAVASVSSQVTAIFPEPSTDKMAATPESLHKTAATPEPVAKMAVTPEPLHKMAVTPEPVHKMAAILKPVHKMAAVSKPYHKMAAILGQHLDAACGHDGS
ncbi:hypothetical protein M9458_053394, partial [Cirrhinus mrigala]